MRLAPDSNVRVGVFLVHAQADYAARKYRQVRWKQLEALADECSGYAQPGRLVLWFAWAI